MGISGRMVEAWPGWSAVNLLSESSRPGQFIDASGTCKAAAYGPFLYLNGYSGS